MGVSTRMLGTLTHEVRHQYQGNWHAGTVWRARIYQGGGLPAARPRLTRH